MTDLVIDASALIDALVGTEQVAIQEMIAGRPLVAPAHVDAEVLSGLRGLTLGGHLSRTRCLDALTDLRDLPLERWPLDDGLLRRAFDFAANLTSYDALYVALAEALDAPLLTRDARLARTARRWVRVEFA